MPSFIAMFALQQLRDMEQLQRDFGRRRTRRRRDSPQVDPVLTSRREGVRQAQVSSPATYG